MKPMLVSFVTLVALAMLSPLAACAATVRGRVTAASGNALPGVRVIVQDSGGKLVQSAVSDDRGAFAISGLAAGNYRFSVDTGRLNFKAGGPAAGHVSDKGLTLDWILSPTAEPIALARDGTTEQADDPFGFSWAQLSLIGAAVSVGGTASGVAAAEATSGTEPVVSASK